MTIVGCEGTDAAPYMQNSPFELQEGMSCSSVNGPVYFASDLDSYYFEVEGPTHDDRNTEGTYFVISQECYDAKNGWEHVWAYQPYHSHSDSHIEWRCWSYSVGDYTEDGSADILCETQAPTEPGTSRAPTLAPTLTPTKPPTPAPTSQPTRAKPCSRGTYGNNTEGGCFQCPSNFHSLLGARTSDDCYPVGNNIFAVSEQVDRLLVLNNKESEFQTMIEGHPLNYPRDLLFYNSTSVFVVNQGDRNVILMNIDTGFSEIIYAFSDDESPTGMIYTKTRGRIAVIDHAQGVLFFFDLDKFFEDRTQFAEPSSAVELPNARDGVHGIAIGMTGDTILYSFWDNGVFAYNIRSNSNNQLSRGYDPKQLALLASRSMYIVISRNGDNSKELHACPSNTDNLHISSCEMWVPPDEGFQPEMSITVDDEKEIVYIGDNNHAVVWIYDFEGSYLGKVNDKPGGLSSVSGLAIKPSSSYPPLTTLTSPQNGTAGAAFNITVNLHDSLGKSISSDKVKEVLHRYSIIASGEVTPYGSTVPLDTEIEGNVFIKKSGEMIASITLPYAGLWSITVTEGIIVKQDMQGSPFLITVSPSKTDPALCVVELESREVIAGGNLTVILSTYDKFRNPTSWEDDSFEVWVAGGEVEKLSRSENGNIHFLLHPTIVGEFKLHISTEDGAEVFNSPFNFEVEASSPVHHLTRHNLPTEIHTDRVRSKVLRFDASLFDAYGNIATIDDSDNHRVTVKCEEELVSIEEIDKTTFELTIPAMYEGELTISVELDDNHIIGSPALIKAIPPGPFIQDPTIFWIIGFISAAVVTLISFLSLRHWRKSQKSIRKLNIARSDLKQENEFLHESLKKKMHSEEEMNVMMAAMREQEAARQDELRAVLLPSKDVKIEKMIGQGGMGSVHLGEYKGQKVAVKTLKQINSNTVSRFRLEALLTKELRHPNIVKLVGVCWDEMLLALVLEYVSGGSLEGRIRSDWILPKPMKMTWKGCLLDFAVQAATGVNYLHKSRYYDEKKNQWKECIIHRDLKPDNMLVTEGTPGTLKLTDFGEARAEDLNITMTMVGTPIYLSPEVFKGERYDYRCDTYSFAVTLVAMMRQKKDIIDYFFDEVRKKLRRGSVNGIGIHILNRSILQGWRPQIAVEMYPSLTKLVGRCWSDSPDMRPDMEEVLRILNEEVRSEVHSNPEPEFNSGRLIVQGRQEEARGDVEPNRHAEIEDVVAREAYDSVLEELKSVKSQLNSMRARQPSTGAVTIPGLTIN